MGALRSIRCSCAIAALPAGAAALANDAPLIMAPVSNWVMDYADDSCALRRAFEGDGERAVLELRQFGPGDDFQITVTSDTLSRTARAPRVRFEPDDDLREPVGALFFDSGATRGVMFSGSLRPNAVAASPPVAPWTDDERNARERSIAGLTVTSSFERGFQLQTGSMHPPMQAMRTCTDELLTHWGIDPGVHRALTRGPMPIDQMSWARRVQQSYPTDQLRRGQSGRVNIRLIVGADGRPTACIASKDSPTSVFDEHACKTSMRYARFEPALDANGVPVASFFMTTVVYQVYR